jgi:hypothetical protein
MFTVRKALVAAVLVGAGLLTPAARAEEADRFGGYRAPSRDGRDAQAWRDWAYQMWGPGRGAPARSQFERGGYSPWHAPWWRTGYRSGPWDRWESRYGSWSRYAPPPPARREDPYDRRAEIERKLDRLQRELDDLRRELRRR